MTTDFLEDLCRDRHYERYDIEGWREYAVTKCDFPKRLMIVVASGIDIETGVARDCGKDAIQCFLALADEDPMRPVWVMKHTKRIDRAIQTLHRKLDLLERVLTLSPCCPNEKHGRQWMVPRVARTESAQVFWGCRQYHDLGCRETRRFPPDLGEQLLAEHKRSRR